MKHNRQTQGQADTLYKIAYDMSAFYEDMDPYGARDCMEPDETTEEFLDRMAKSVTGAGQLRLELDDWTAWGWTQEPETAQRINEFRSRLDKLDAGTEAIA